jgi:hypothetical protein
MCAVHILPHKTRQRISMQGHTNIALLTTPHVMNCGIACACMKSQSFVEPLIVHAGWSGKMMRNVAIMKLHWWKQYLRFMAAEG